MQVVDNRKHGKEVMMMNLQPGNAFDFDGVLLMKMDGDFYTILSSQHLTDKGLPMLTILTTKIVEDGCHFVQVGADIVQSYPKGGCVSTRRVTLYEQGAGRFYPSRRFTMMDTVTVIPTKMVLLGRDEV